MLSFVLGLAAGTALSITTIQFTTT